RFSRDWSSDVCSSDLDRFAGEDLIADGRLDRHFEHLTRNILLHLLSYLSASDGRFIAVDNKRQGIHALTVQQDVDFHQFRRLVRSEERRVGKEWRAGR